MTSELKKGILVADIRESDNHEEALAIANLALQPQANAAAVIKEYSLPFGKQDWRALSDSLAETINQVHNGDMKSCEAMLLSQAQVLQTIFVNMACQAIDREYIDHCDSLLRLALKAQSQCRSTLETLATMKNPPMIFVKQANIAQGHQQINNGLSSSTLVKNARAEKNKFDSNELLEKLDEQWLDTRTTSTSGSIDSELEAVGVLNRPEKQKR